MNNSQVYLEKKLQSLPKIWNKFHENLFFVHLNKKQKTDDEINLFQKIIIDDYESTYNFLKKNSLNVYATSLNGEKNIDKINYNKSCAVVVGSENLGISKFWDTKSDELIKIPMLGSIDSLNVSVSAAIVLYEINRQNDFNR